MFEVSAMGMSNDTPRRLRSVRAGVAIAIVVGVVAAGGAMAWALSADGDPTPDQAVASSATPADEHEHADAADRDHDEATSTDEAGSADEAGRERDHRRRHDHPELPPYAERYANATDDEREAADALLTDVRETLADYADADAAVAAGYRPAPDPRGRIVHYANPQVARDGHVLDPTDPNGLVYYSPPEGDPVLLGAFFVVPPGTPAPTPAGDLMVWHSHSPSCSQFFVDDGQDDCLDTRRMVHVWTAERVEMTARRTGQPVDVRITDPFGAPFAASIERAG
jgi:hypothetical protein